MKQNSYELLNPRLKVVIAEDGVLPALDGSRLTNLPGGELTAGVSSFAGKSGDITVSTEFLMTEAKQLQLAASIARYSAASQTFTATTNAMTLKGQTGVEIQAAAGNITIDPQGAGAQVDITGDLLVRGAISIGSISDYNGNALNTAGSLLLLNDEGKVPDELLPDVSAVTSIGGKSGVITLDSTLTMTSSNQLKVADNVFMRPSMTSIPNNMISWVLDSSNRFIFQTASGGVAQFTAGFGMQLTLNSGTGLTLRQDAGWSLVSAVGTIKNVAVSQVLQPMLSYSTQLHAFYANDGTTQYLDLGVKDSDPAEAHFYIPVNIDGNVDATTFTRNGAAENAPNGIPVLDDKGKLNLNVIPEGVTGGVESIDGKEGAFTTSADLTVSDTNVIGVTSNTFLRLTNTSDVVVTTTGSFSFTATSGAIRFNATENNFTGNAVFADDVTFNGGQVSIAGNLVYQGHAMDAANGIPTLDDKGLIKVAQIPPIALTEVLPVEADGTSDINTLLRKAATDKGLTEVQSGEFIVVSRPDVDPDPAPEQSYWDSVCGNYIVAKTVAAAELVKEDTIKSYVPNLSITVNGVSATNGNIVINLENIADVTTEQATLLKSIKVEDGVPSISNIPLATQAQISGAYTLSRVTVNPADLTTSDATWPAAGEVYAYRNDGTVVVRINRASAAGSTLPRNWFDTWFNEASGKSYIVPDVTYATQGEGNALNDTFIVLTLDFGTGYVFTGSSLDIGLLSPVVATA